MTLSELVAEDEVLALVIGVAVATIHEALGHRTQDRIEAAGQALASVHQYVAETCPHLAADVGDLIAAELSVRATEAVPSGPVH